MAIPSVEEEPSFVPWVEGKPLYSKGKPLSMGSDGIALSPDGSRLSYTMLAGHRLYSVPTSALADRNADAEAMVKDEGEKGKASDGLEMDSQGRVYATNEEQASLVRREGNSRWTTVTRFDRTLWPDTLSITDNWLCCRTNGLHSQKDYGGRQGPSRAPVPAVPDKIAGHSSGRLPSALAGSPLGLVRSTKANRGLPARGSNAKVGRNQPPSQPSYWSSVTCSIHSTGVPS